MNLAVFCQTCELKRTNSMSFLAGKRTHDTAKRTHAIMGQPFLLFICFLSILTPNGF